MHVLKYISLFSGGFGLDLGLEQAATADFTFRAMVCVDNAPAARETIRHNRRQVPVVGDRDDEFGGDLTRLSTRRLLQRAGLARREADLVVGGPPCQSWSILGKRQGFGAANGGAMLHFVRVVKQARPRAALDT